MDEMMGDGWMMDDGLDWTGLDGFFKGGVLSAGVEWSGVDLWTDGLTGLGGSCGKEIGD